MVLFADVVCGGGRRRGGGMDGRIPGKSFPLLPVFARGPIYRFLGDGGWWPWKNITGYIY